MLIILFILCSLVSTILIMLNTFVGLKKSVDREKLSAFECGFDPKSPARLPFSLHFFLIALIFLIFDVEITLILPLPLISNVSIFFYFELILLFFVIILITGTLIEWLEGSLDWSF